MNTKKIRQSRHNAIEREYGSIVNDSAALVAVRRALVASERQGAPVNEGDAEDWLADYAASVAMGQTPTSIDRPKGAAQWVRTEVKARHRVGDTWTAAPRDPQAGQTPDAISDGVYEAGSEPSGMVKRSAVRSDADAAAEPTRSLDIRAWAPVAVEFDAKGSPVRVGPEDPRHPCHLAYAEVRETIAQDMRDWSAYAEREPSPAVLAVLAVRAHPYATPGIIAGAIEQATGREVAPGTVRSALSRTRRTGEPKDLRAAFDGWAWGQLHTDRVLAQWVGRETVSGPPADRFDALSAEVGSALASVLS
jgi:hypothetical protein